VLKGQTYRVLNVQNGQLVEKEVPMLNALNEVLRDDYIKDSIAGVERWNKVIEKAGIPFRLNHAAQGLPPQHRRAGGREGGARRPVVSEAEWAPTSTSWLPTDERPRLRGQPDGPRGRARQVRQLDRAAGDGHQPPAGRLRVRAVSIDPPRCGFAAPPQGGDARGPAEPDPRRLLILRAPLCVRCFSHERSS
jgi:hypothetical protein